MYSLCLAIVLVCLVESQPRFTGQDSLPDTELAYCSYLGEHWSNANPCKGSPTVVEGCSTSNREGSLCSNSLGGCVAASGGNYVCRFCESASSQLGNFGLTSPGNFDGQCRLQTATDKDVLRVSRGFVAWHRSGVDRTLPPELVPFANDTTTLRRRITINRNSNPLFNVVGTTRLIDASSPQFVHQVPMGLGVRLHESDATVRDYPLSSLIFPRWATRRNTTSRPWWWAPTIDYQEYYRLNGSDFLNIFYRNATTQPLRMFSRGDFPQTVFDVTTLAVPYQLATTTALRTAMLTPSLDLLQKINLTISAQPEFSYVRQEMGSVVGISGASHRRTYHFLDYSQNTLLCGANPLQALLFNNALLNKDTPSVNILTQTQILQQSVNRRDPINSVEIVGSVALVIRRRSGSIEFTPIYEDLRTTNAPSIHLPNLRDVRLSSFNSSSRQDAYNRIAAAFTTASVVSKYGTKEIYYTPGSRFVRIFGNNSVGEFGIGATTVGQVFAGESDVEVVGLPSGEGINAFHLGFNHSVLISTSGVAYVAGDMRFSHADCTATRPGAVYTSFTRISNITDIVQGASAGYDFSMFIVANRSAIVCGGAGYMSGGEAYANMSQFWGLDRSMEFSSLCSGVYFGCVATRGTSGGPRYPEIRCWGASDTLRNDERLNANPLQNNAFANTQATDSSFLPQATSPSLFRSADTFSCGNHHVVITMLEKFSGHAGYLAFPNFRSVYTAGSNSKGQLGANLRIPRPTRGAVYPVSGVDERVFSTRSPNRREFRENGNTVTGVDLEKNYPLFETLSAYALGDTTFVHTISTTYNTPQFFIGNVSMTTRHSPPDGSYLISSICTDCVRDIIGNAQVQGTLPANWDEWKVVFSDLSPLPLFLVSNQTSTSTWITYVGNVDGTLPPTTLTSPDLSSGVGFFRNWQLLRRNITTASGLSRNITLQLPVVFFKTSNGKFYSKSHLSTRCTPGGSSFVLWCDEEEKVVVWGHGLSSSPPAGYSHVVDGVIVKWIAMYIVPNAVNVSFFNESDTDTLAARWVTTADNGFYVSSWTRDRLHLCKSVYSSYDCTSARFYETFNMTKKDEVSQLRFSRLLNARTFQDTASLTQTSSFGAFYNGVAGHTTSTTVWKRAV